MKKSIKETVREAILPTVTELGYRIWDISYSKIGADYHLEITIDNDEGINIDDCEKVHRAIEVIIDEAEKKKKNIVIDRSGEVNLVARVSPRSTARGGDVITVAIDTERVDIFDKDTEKCICH